LDPALNELLLLHGSKQTKIEEIGEDGFDVRLAKTSGLYGEGVYFTDQRCKSLQYCDKEGERCFILSRALVGDPFYTEAQQKTLVRPPARRHPGKGRYDSIVANVGIANGVSVVGQQHREFVLFNGAQTYPEFAIYFTV